MKLRAGLAVLISILIAADAREDPTKRNTASREENSTKEDMKKIQGTWMVMAVEIEGKATPQKEIDDWRLVFMDDKLINGSGKGASQETYKLDATKRPKTIDMIWSDGMEVKTALGIYRLQGDDLTICQHSNSERPKEFKTAKGSRTALYTLKRERK